MNKIVPQTKKIDHLEVAIYPDMQTMSEAAAKQASEILCEAIKKKGSASVILATGNSMLSFLFELTNLHEVDWSRVDAFHMDEYLGMPETHPASFRRYLKEKFVEKVHPRSFHGVMGDAPDSRLECERYAALLKEFPPDLCCLGIGENGHLAFNDPPVANFEDTVWVKVVELDQACRMQQVGEGHFSSLEAAPKFALTLTIPALLAAKNVLAIVPEKRKAQPVKNTLYGPVTTACPASILRRQPHARLYLDNDSGSLLYPFAD